MKDINTPKLVSIIMPSYNRENTIARAIKSVSNQTYVDYELIIVDDGSTDNTEELIKGLNNDKIIYIKHKINRGAATARNTGLKIARGEYIAFQDSDDEWMPDKLEKQIKVMDSYKESDVVYSDLVRIDKSGNAKDYESPAIINGEIINRKTKDYSPVFLSLPSVIIRSYIFLEGKEVFDERLPCFIDLEFFIRLLIKGYNFYHLKESLGKYYVTEDSISNNRVSVTYARRAILEIYWNSIKNHRGFLGEEFYRIGISLYKNNKVEEGRRLLFKAWIKCFWNLKYIITFACMLTGKKFFFFINDLKRYFYENPEKNEAHL